MYLAQQRGFPIDVWVSETRPRNQGAALTAWELDERGVPLTVIADNSAGHLIQRGLVDIVIVGADRVTAAGDVGEQDRYLPQGIGRTRASSAILCGVSRNYH